jgi:hypothetical protein
MGFEIKQALEKAGLLRNRLMTKERVLILSLNGLAIFGVEKLPFSPGEGDPSGILRAVLLPMLIILYFYLACRINSFIRHFLNRSAADTDPFREGQATFFGRLKSVSESRSNDPSPRFILEDATNSPIPTASPRFIEISLSPLSHHAAVMSDYLGKRLMIAGKISFNPLKGRQEVVPEVILEVIP